MDKQYIYIVIVLAFIFIYYYHKNKELSGKVSFIDKLIDTVNNTFKKLVSNKVIQTSVWTYVEPYSFEKEIHSEQKKSIPDFFQLCIEKMKQLNPNLIVLTPDTISKYIKNFPIKMGNNSEYPLRERIDLLFAFILEKYGGVCLSPATIVSNIDELIYQSTINDIVSVGSSPEVIGYSIDKMYPNTYVIGGKKGSSFLKLYKQTLLKNYGKKNKQLSDVKSYGVLSSLLKYKLPKQVHFSDGTYDDSLKKIDIPVFLSKTNKEYESYSHLISLPYEELFEKKYLWFLNMSKQELLSSNILITKYLI
tara:strand:- start:1661 stop:2578 length:918 start_codon:yes stop_codon:yes gene_type:complete